MSKLIRGQDDSVSAQKKLAAAQAQLASYTGDQNDKAKKIMMNFANQSSKGLMSSSFKGWSTHVKSMRIENEIHAEYADRLDNATKRLLDFKGGQLKGVRGVMEKKGAALDTALIQELYKLWYGQVLNEKENKANAGAVADLELKLKSMQGSQKEKANQVMMKMNAGNDMSLLNAVFKALLQFHADYQKDKEMEDQVKASEKQMKEFLKNKSEGAKKILGNMSGASDSGLLSLVIKGWIEIWDDAKKEAEMEAILAEADQKKQAFGDRNKKNGGRVCDRATHQQNLALLLGIFYEWRLDAAVTANHRSNLAKVDSKRQQLLGVQLMFRDFAGQLETQLKGSAGDDTSRGQKYRTTSKKGGGQCSLPNINSNRSGKA